MADTFQNLRECQCSHYISAIVLGMNDALVEMTGALAGFTMVLGENRLIALAGFTTGVAATLSMAAAEFLAEEQDDSSRKPTLAALFTGVTYLVTVTVLLLPFLLLSKPIPALIVCLVLAFLIILGFTYTVTKIRKTCFLRSFRRMLIISFGVSAAAFSISWLAKIFWNIDV